MARGFFRFSIFPVLSAMLLVVSSPTAQAEKTLRYKFKQGDKLVSSMNQVMDIKMNVVGQNVEMKMDQQIEMSQVVKAVDSAGVADIVQKITRIRVEMNGPPGSSMKYDSADKKKPEGGTRANCPSL